MAIICRKWGLLYVMRGGTGCSSTGAALVKHLDGEHLPKQNIIRDGKTVFGRKHNTIPELKRMNFISDDELRSLLVFSNVRNPFDLVASEYARETTVEWTGGFSRDSKGKLLPVSEEKMAEHRARVERVKELGFDRWVEKRYGALARLKRLLRSLAGRRTVLDFYKGVSRFVKFENLETEFNQVLGEVGCREHITVPNTNPTAGRKPYQDYYSENSIGVVSRAFRHDIKRFGYRFEAVAER